MFIISFSWLFAANNYYIFLFSALLFFIAYYKSIRGINYKPKSLSSLKFSYVDYFIYFSIIILISLNGLEVQDGLVLVDSMHPSYEHSIGHSYADSIIAPMDLSFFGKTLKWHFLSTQITRVFEKLGFSFLESVYILTPNLLFSLTFYLLTTVLNEISIKTRYSSIYLLLPLGFETILSRYILGAPSFALGFQLILLSYYFFRKNNILLFFIFSFVLLFVKGPYYLTLIGFVFLKIINSKSIYQMRDKIYLLIIMLLTFFVVFYAFYNGAHGYNHWYLFGFIHSFIIGLNPIPFIIFIYIFAIIFRSIYLGTKIHAYNSDLLIISGMIGSLLLLESTEFNNWQFFISTYPFMIISLHRRKVFESRLILLLWFFLFSTSISHYLRKPFINIVHNLIDKKILNIDLKKYSQLRLSSSSKDLYENLKKLTDKSTSVIWHSPIYERNMHNYSFFPSNGFLRSAISNRFLFLENMKYKGVAMEDQFEKRFSMSLLWYANNVLMSENNEKTYNSIMTTIDSYKTNDSIQSSSGSKIKLLLSFGKKYSYENIVPIKLNGINNILLKNSKNEVQLDSIITHIVLEDGDSLIDNNQNENWKILYSNDEGQIWERK
ncbi:hypothetical protein N9W06_03080 [Candidatus Marinimicrobia bacterium]|nr:hypothetical protein [Candidatus Neomarinimicrobiota bacterium]